MAAIAAALASLAAMGASIGLTEGLTAVEERLVMNQPSINDLQSKVNAIIDAASRKGSSVLDKITSRLEQIVAPFGMSDSVRQYIASARRKLVDKRQEVQKVMDDISQKSAQATGYVSAHENISNIGKLTKPGQVLRDKANYYARGIQDQQSALTQIERKL